GQSPFKRKNSMQTLMASMQAPHTPLIEECPGVSEKLSHVVDVCLAKEQGDRYADGAALLADLKECLALVGTGPVKERVHRGDDSDAAFQPGSPEAAAQAAPAR